MGPVLIKNTLLGTLLQQDMEEMLSQRLQGDRVWAEITLQSPNS